METTTRVDRLEANMAGLAAAQTRTEVALAQLAEAQAHTEAALTRTGERLSQLAASQGRTDEVMRDLAIRQGGTDAIMKELAAAELRTEARLDSLAQWQQGEAGRRKGERFERDIIRSASMLFAGGYGAPPSDFVLQERMATLLAPLGQDGLPLDLRSYDNVFAADLIWWKGDHVVLVEISHVVEEHDVERAARRAAVLRRAGADALPVVIGEFWANGEVRAVAELSRMAWKVGNDVSERFIAFRRLPASPVS